MIGGAGNISSLETRRIGGVDHACNVQNRIGAFAQPPKAFRLVERAVDP
jgi:hypothetical protein